MKKTILIAIAFVMSIFTIATAQKTDSTHRIHLVNDSARKANHTADSTRRVQHQQNGLFLQVVPTYLVLIHDSVDLVIIKTNERQAKQKVDTNTIGNQVPDSFLVSWTLAYKGNSKQPRKVLESKSNTMLVPAGTRFKVVVDKIRQYYAGVLIFIKK